MAHLRVREYGQEDDRIIEFVETGNGTADWKDKLARSETTRIRHASNGRDKARRYVASFNKVAANVYHVQTGYDIGTEHNQTTLDNVLIVTVYHDGE